MSTPTILNVAMATAWRPTPGETLVGALVHREVRSTEYGVYPVVYLAPEGSDGLIAVHAFHTTLKDGLKEMAPQRGEYISLTYVGMKESGKRTDGKGDPVEYHHYVVCDPGAVISTEALDWDDAPF